MTAEFVTEFSDVGLELAAPRSGGLFVIRANSDALADELRMNRPDNCIVLAPGDDVKVEAH